MDTEFSWPFAEIAQILEDAMGDPDHHRWCTRVGNNLRVTPSVVWARLAKLWVHHCLTEAQIADLDQAVRDRLPNN